MSDFYENIKNELDTLIKKGYSLLFAFIKKNTKGDVSDSLREELLKSNIDFDKLPSFDNEYEIWYTMALKYVSQLAPERMSDFVSLYKNEKRKKIDHSTYTISDAIQGIVVSTDWEVLADTSAATSKLSQQITILVSTKELLQSHINTFQFSIRAELFDSELLAAQGLLKSGFLRAAGAMCGVVLEKHLAQVCLSHKITIRKKAPTINDFNEELKNIAVIDLPTWRHLQLLGDFRNICCHNKSIEPTKEQVEDLFNGTSKIIKTVF